jgi:lysozyme
MTTVFDHPWNDQKRAPLIDPYHENSIDWVQLSTEPRVAAIIHKSTSGNKEMDSVYLCRKQAAKSRGYLWGSYYWGVTGKPEEQADHYIDKGKGEKGTDLFYNFLVKNKCE